MNVGRQQGTDSQGSSAHGRGVHLRWPGDPRQRSQTGETRDEGRAEEHSLLSQCPPFLPPSKKQTWNYSHIGKKPNNFTLSWSNTKPNPLQTSWICWSLSSGELRVSCSLFRLSRREMSLAANSAGSIGTISFGGHRVRFVRKDIKLAVVSLPKHQPYVNFFKDFLSTYLITLKHCSPSVPSSLLVVLIRALS